MARNTAPDLRASLSVTRLHVLDGWSYSQREIWLKAGLSCWSCAYGLDGQTLKHISKIYLIPICTYLYLNTLYFFSVCMYKLLTVFCSGIYFLGCWFPLSLTKEKAFRPPVRKMFLGSSLESLLNWWVGMGFSLKFLGS